MRVMSWQRLDIICSVCKYGRDTVVEGGDSGDTLAICSTGAGKQSHFTVIARCQGAGDALLYCFGQYSGVYLVVWKGVLWNLRGVFPDSFREILTSTIRLATTLQGTSLQPPNPPTEAVMMSLPSSKAIVLRCKIIMSAIPVRRVLGPYKSQGRCSRGGA